MIHELFLSDAGDEASLALTVVAPIENKATIAATRATGKTVPPFRNDG
jgi:hypothetical protein